MDLENVQKWANFAEGGPDAPLPVPMHVPGDAGPGGLRCHPAAIKSMKKRENV
jgi:hypothetical protein